MGNASSTTAGPPPTSTAEATTSTGTKGSERGPRVSPLSLTDARGQLLELDTEQIKRDAAADYAFSRWQAVHKRVLECVRMDRPAAAANTETLGMQDKLLRQQFNIANLRALLVRVHSMRVEMFIAANEDQVLNDNVMATTRTLKMGLDLEGIRKTVEEMEDAQEHVKEVLGQMNELLGVDMANPAEVGPKGIGANSKHGGFTARELLALEEEIEEEDMAAAAARASQHQQPQPRSAPTISAAEHDGNGKAVAVEATLQQLPATPTPAPAPRYGEEKEAAPKSKRTMTPAS